MVPRSGLQHAAVTSYGYKLQGLRIQVRQIARERDKARLDLEKAERRCLQLGRELDEQYVALEHAQSKLKDVQGETEAKELLLQQSVNHQAKLEADTQFLKGIQASLQGRLNHTMKENTQLQNKVTEMAEKLVASEKLVLELQKELNRTVNDKLRQVEPHSPELLNQSECFAEIVLEYERQCQASPHRAPLCWCAALPALWFPLLCAQRRHSQWSSSKSSCRTCRCSWKLRPEPDAWLSETGPSLGRPWFAALWPEAGHIPLPERKHLSKLDREKVEDLAQIAELTASSETSKGEVSHLNVKMCQLGRVLTEHKAGHGAGHGTVQLRSQRLAEAEWLQGADTATRLEHHQQHAACWMEMELLRQQLKASQEKLLEAKASLSLAQTRHALQLQQAKAQMNNMVPKKQFEQLQISLREEQCKGQQLQENLHQQAEQTRKQLVRTQEEYERLLQAAVEQAEELEHNLRSAEAVLAERAAQLKDVQAQLFRNKLLIEDLREESREFAMALQAAELKQKSSEEKNQLLEKQASALKQLIGKITPASLSV
ncbi:ninein-like protein isoform X1 [Grus americana]|uniref:ninein-like protein isoform X1 n=1 Tax=Grus americana TaxID=9117 RepID=UPI002408257B|nr:ninein-like protein isoform X1 [Grus americana]XP_054677332.1 ninein-like protein isoform X1 [Grus americana]XP_054677333.1 ninein-like protein isoform X1 [Grus americana]